MYQFCWISYCSFEKCKNLFARGQNSSQLGLLEKIEVPEVSISPSGRELYWLRVEFSLFWRTLLWSEKFIFRACFQAIGLWAQVYWLLRSFRGEVAQCVSLIARVAGIRVGISSQFLGFELRAPSIECHCHSGLMPSKGPLIDWRTIKFIFENGFLGCCVLHWPRRV